MKRGRRTQEKIFCSSLNVVDATLYRFNFFMRGFNYSFGTKSNEYVYLVKLKISDGSKSIYGYGEALSRDWHLEKGISAKALITDFTASNERAKGISVLSLAQTLPAVTSSIGAILYDVSKVLPFYTATCVYLLALLLSFILRF